LSKALKIKNRLAGRLVKVQQTITTYNSIVEGRADEVNVVQLDKDRAELVEALINLKTAIYEGNKGIYRHIIQMAEKKSEIQLLSALNTRNGSEPDFSGINVKYVAAIKKTEVDKRVKQLEKELDDLQDHVDSYNATPDRIKVTARVLELAS
jgi:hypothetical protein